MNLILKRGSSLSSASTGAMAFCARCPTSKNCCSRVAHGSAVENPFVFESEVLALAAAADRQPEAFLEQRESSARSSYLVLQAVESGCIFLREGRCGVYNARPLDCRLFPFDVRRDESGNLVWIVYTALCPVTFDVGEIFQDTKKMFYGAGIKRQELEAYADCVAPGMALQSVDILESVQLSNFED